MTVYEYPGDYQAEADLTAQVQRRIDRVADMLAKLKADWNTIDMEADGGDGDVVLSVNHQGRLMSLALAMGVTSRYSAHALQDLFNDTLRAATEAATAQAAAATGAEEDQALRTTLDEFTAADNPAWAE